LQKPIQKTVRKNLPIASYVTLGKERIGALPGREKEIKMNLILKILKDFFSVDEDFLKECSEAFERRKVEEAMRRLHFENEIRAVVNGIIHHSEAIGRDESKEQVEISKACRESYLDSLRYWIQEEKNYTRQEYESIGRIY
jgi:hypothetical protein